MKQISLLVYIFLLTFASCKKNKAKNVDCALSITTLAGNYKITSVTYRGTPSDTPVPAYDALFDDCNKDDIITFNTDNTLNYTDAGVSCSPNETRNTTFTLTGTSITFEGKTGTIENFTCDNFVITASSVFASGDKVFITYTRQ